MRSPTYDMCRQCFADYGAPQVKTDNVQHAVELLADPFLPLNALHEITSGWDLRDDTVNHCRRKARNKPESAIASLFARMSISERATALAIDQGFIQSEIAADVLNTGMENEAINIRPLVPLMIRGHLYEIGEIAEVSRERARTLIQRGHARPIAKPEDELTKLVEKPKPRRRRKSKAKEPADD